MSESAAESVACVTARIWPGLVVEISGMQLMRQGPKRCLIYYDSETNVRWELGGIHRSVARWQLTVAVIPTGGPIVGPSGAPATTE